MIGRGGTVIGGIMQSTSAKIKLSQNTEFFPDTTDRIILVIGSAEAIALAIAEIVTKICEVRHKIRLIYTLIPFMSK